MERLAETRQDPPGRVWGVKHNDGNITVHITGHPFESRWNADRERRSYDAQGGECEWCDGGKPARPHTLACRDTPPWRDE
jgi:hypothetical protein